MSFTSLPTAGTNVAGQKQTKRDLNMLALSDEKAMMKQILATHAPDGREFDVRPLLNVVEDILNRAGSLYADTTLTAGRTQAEMEDKKRQVNFIAMLEALSYVIDRIACEISYMALSGMDTHSITLSLFNMLASYSWDAKLVLTMAAFALNYGEFWLLAQIYSSNPLAKSMAILRQLPSILENTVPLKPRFNALNNLIKVMLDVTKCIVEFRELPSVYFPTEVPALTAAMAHIPTAVYWAIKSAVACATQITNLATLGYEFGTNEAWELSTLAHKLQNILDHLSEQLSLCHKHIEEKKNVESYQMLLNIVEATQIDNMKILKALIYSKDDIQPLVDGTTKKRVNLDVLRRKNVLLLISSLDISHDELSILEHIYNESRIHATRLESQYEMVWIPIVDRTVPYSDLMHKKFEGLQATMPWYSVYHPTIIEKVVIRFIKEEWHFRNKPILVVLDPQGKVVSPNALHMMWIWGSSAFPFTTSKEEALWKEEKWRLELLIDGIDPTILNWIKEGKYIFLYGGDDIEWIKKFIKEAKAVAQAARIPLEMVYMGKSTKREKVQRVIATITVEKIGYVCEDMALIWFFWIRLESMLLSKIQLGKIDEFDPTMQEIKKLLSYDKEGGWAVLSKGSNVVVNGYRNTVFATLLEYDLWRDYVPTKGFDLSFKEHHDKLHDDTHPCCRFEFPSTIGRIPERFKCPECQRAMEKLITFCCCHDDIPEALNM